jgi:hypothetical protein
MAPTGTNIRTVGQLQFDSNRVGNPSSPVRNHPLTIPTRLSLGIDDLALIAMARRPWRYPTVVIPKKPRVFTW